MQSFLQRKIDEHHIMRWNPVEIQNKINPVVMDKTGTNKAFVVKFCGMGDIWMLKQRSESVV